MIKLVAFGLPALALLTISGPAAAQAVSCQTFMNTYEGARLVDTNLPPLFAKPFEFSDLTPAKIGDIAIEGRLTELPIAVKNHTGYLDCDPGDRLVLIELCASLVPPDLDPLLEERFQRTSQALLSALAPTERIEPLIVEAGKNLEAALIRGDSVPSGVSSDLKLGEFLSARVHTIPESPGLSPAQMCFMAEYFEG